MNFDLYGIKFKNFKNLTELDQKMVLSWRNHESIRKFMFNKNIISWEDHLSFINSLHKKTDKQYWMVEYKGCPIGVVDIYNITDKSCWWGYYVNPEYLGKSYGFLLEYLILEIVFEKINLQVIKCETLKINKSVIGFHEFFGFVYVESSEDVIVMQNTKSIWDNKKKEFKKYISKFLE